VKLAQEYAARDICALAIDFDTLKALQLSRHEKGDEWTEQLVPRVYSYDLLRDKSESSNVVMIVMELLVSIWFQF